MVALLDQVREVVDAASKAVSVHRLCCGVVMVKVVGMMMVVVGAGCVVDKTGDWSRAGARKKVCEQAGDLCLAQAGARTLSVVT